MSEFRTIVHIPEAKSKLEYSDKIMFLGSCFAENIGNLFESQKFNVSVNPFGIIYNPLSVANALSTLLDEKEFTEEDLIYSNEKWSSLYHHGRFSDVDKQICLNRLNASRRNSRIFLEDTSFLFITFGTSWVYEYIEKSTVVSNCHKLPAKDFRRYRLTVDDIVDTYKELIVKLRYFNPNIKVIFTVSPIRHLKDTAHGNQLSKSVLLLAIDELIDNLPNIEYFPSYEILMDELRDYRFYSDDMIHISELSVNYIWKRLKETQIAPSAHSAMKEVEKLNKSLKHKYLSGDMLAYRKFLTKTLTKLDYIENKYKNIDFSEDRQSLVSRIKSIEIN